MKSDGGAGGVAGCPPAANGSGCTGHSRQHLLIAPGFVSHFCAQHLTHSAITVLLQLLLSLLFLHLASPKDTVRQCYLSRTAYNLPCLSKNRHGIPDSGNISTVLSVVSPSTWEGASQAPGAFAWTNESPLFLCSKGPFLITDDHAKSPKPPRSLKFTEGNPPHPWSAATPPVCPLRAHVCHCMSPTF